MKRFTFCLVSLVCCLLSIAQTKEKVYPQLGKASVREVLAAMTLEEKATLAGGMGGIDKKLRVNPQPVVGHTLIGVPGAAGVTNPFPHLNIPMLILADGPAGVRIDVHRNNDMSRSYYATAFPVATLLASSWDTELVEKVGKAFGHEAHEYGVDVLLAPAMNIHRNPLGGRNFEYYSEDPLVSGRIAAAMINGIESNGVGTSIKHFAANNEETNRLEVSSEVTERTLREIYLRGFEIAVREAQPWTVMSSYNLINGVYTAESKDLLTTILRKEWGFEGVVVTDWFGGKDAIAMMKAGNDLLMPGWAEQTQSIIDAVKEGKLDEEVLDRNVERILNLVVKCPSFKKYPYSNTPELKKNGELVRKVAAESMVLLKNEQEALPLKKNLYVALFGAASYDNIAGGSGSGGVNKAYSVSLCEGLRNAGYRLNEDMKANYEKYVADFKREYTVNNPLVTPPAMPEMPLDLKLVNKMAEQAAVAVVTIGKNAGEGADRKEADFGLSKEEMATLQLVSKAFRAKGKKVIAVLNISNVIKTADWIDYADAVLLAWQPGQEGGNAITDILNGKVNPSGKLATTFPVEYKDVPSYNNFPGTPKNAVKPNFALYEEGIYVGYRYYNTFGIKTSFPFGFGLSYTQFKYADLKLSTENFNDSITVSVSITNTGKVAGKEVVQLYLHAPAGKLDKPVNELKAFAKTKLLKPGETQILTWTLDPKSLASYDEELSGWVAEAGNYVVNIGASSTDIRISSGFNLEKPVVAELCHKALTPTRTITELKKNK